MLKGMKQQIRSMWKSLTNAVDTNTDNRQLILKREIKGTPFTLTGNEDQGYFLTLGNYRLTEAKETPEEATEEIESNTWNIISRLVAAYIDFDKRLQTNSTEPINNKEN